MSKRQERQRFIRFYKEKTGESEISMRKVAEFAKENGWDMPKPPSDVDMLAKLFADDAQAERRYDAKTKRPYKAYQALPASPVIMDLFVYVDTDEATRAQMLTSSVLRREQIISDVYNLELDLDHWNSIHPDEEPIGLPKDFEMDVEIRKATDGYDEEEDAA
ncbi:MAG: hypothetical protein U1E48_06900 [Paracoccaceae bacterium]